MTSMKFKGLCFATRGTMKNVLEPVLGAVGPCRAAKHRPCIRAFLVTATALCFVSTACACGKTQEHSGDAAMLGSGGESGNDGGVPDAWNRELPSGCTATEEPFSSLPDDVTDDVALLYAKPKATAQAIAGVWTNTSGDTLQLALDGSGTIHREEGMQSGLYGPCNTRSYVAMYGQVKVTSEDGRFDEAFAVEVHLIRGVSYLHAVVGLSSLKGSFHAQEPNDGWLRWDGDYRGGDGAGWMLLANIYRDDTQTEVQTVSLERFDSRP